MKMVDDLKKMHVDILEAIDGLSAEELNKPETIGKWSARDVILHLAMWDGETLKAFAVWRTGHDYDWSYADEYLKFNDFWFENLKALSATQAVQMFNLNRNALVLDAAAVPDEVYQKRGEPNWLPGIAVKHASHHLEKLRAFRKSLGK
jgi:hypothetical protein